MAARHRAGSGSARPTKSRHASVLGERVARSASTTWRRASCSRRLLDAAEKDVNVMQRLRSLPQQGETSPNCCKPDDVLLLRLRRGPLRRSGQAPAPASRQGAQQDRTNVEVLIALYQLTGDEPQKRAEVVKLARRSSTPARSKVDDAPEESPFYNQVASSCFNQIAWLVANTEGDIDEAIRLSHKSIELARAARRDQARRRTARHAGPLLLTPRRTTPTPSSTRPKRPSSIRTPPAIGRQLKVFREALAKQQHAGE